MNNLSKRKQFVKEALTKLFGCVGMTYDEGVKFSMEHDDWYALKTWTFQQEKEYRNWFIKECREKLNCTVKEAKKQWAWWNLNYGWRISR